MTDRKTAIRTAPTFRLLSTELYARLKEDIGVRGCRVPIFVSASGEIVDGRIRDQICKELGIVPRKVMMGELTADEIVEERVTMNSLRRHLSPDELQECIHWARAKNPDASDRVIAGTIGVSPTTVGKARRSSGVQSGHVVGADGKTYKRKTIVYTSSERKAKDAASRLTELGPDAPPGETTVRRLNAEIHKRNRERLLSTLNSEPVKDYIVNHGDFRTANIHPDSMNLVFCDLPWSQAANLAKPAAETIARILKDDSYACVYSGVQHKNGWNDAMRAAGLVPAWEIIVFYTQFKRPLYDGVVMPLHTPILVYRKNPKGRLWSNRRPFRDVIPCNSPEKDFHHWQQALAPAVELIHAFSRPGDLIGDLGVGSGTFAVGTIQAGEGRRFIGWEQDAKSVGVARGRINLEIKSAKKGKAGVTRR